MWNFPGICSLLWTKWSILWVCVAYRLPFCTLCFKVVFSCLKARKKWQGIAWCPKSLAFGNRKSWLQLGPMLCLTLDKSLSKFWFPCNTAKSLNILLLPFFFFFFFFRKPQYMQWKGYPLQCSGLENSTDSVHGVTKSWTRLTFTFTVNLPASAGEEDGLTLVFVELPSL